MGDLAEIERLEEKCSGLTALLACGELGATRAEYRFEAVGAGKDVETMRKLATDLQADTKRPDLLPLLQVCRGLLSEKRETGAGVGTRVLSLRARADGLLFCLAMGITSEPHLANFRALSPESQRAKFVEHAQRAVLHGINASLGVSIQPEPAASIINVNNDPDINVDMLEQDVDWDAAPATQVYTGTLPASMDMDGTEKKHTETQVAWPAAQPKEQQNDGGNSDEEPGWLADASLAATDAQPRPVGTSIESTPGTLAGMKRRFQEKSDPLPSSSAERVVKRSRTVATAASAAEPKPIGPATAGSNSPAADPEPASNEAESQARINALQAKIAAQCETVDQLKAKGAELAASANQMRAELRLKASEAADWKNRAKAAEAEQLRKQVESSARIQSLHAQVETLRLNTQTRAQFQDSVWKSRAEAAVAEKSRLEFEFNARIQALQLRYASLWSKDKSREEESKTDAQALEAMSVELAKNQKELLDARQHEKRLQDMINVVAQAKKDAESKIGEKAELAWQRAEEIKRLNSRLNERQSSIDMLVNNANKQNTARKTLEQQLKDCEAREAEVKCQLHLAHKSRDEAMSKCKELEASLAAEKAALDARHEQMAKAAMQRANASEKAKEELEVVVKQLNMQIDKMTKEMVAFRGREADLISHIARLEESRRAQSIQSKGHANETNNAAPRRAAKPRFGAPDPQPAHVVLLTGFKSETERRKLESMIVFLGGTARHGNFAKDVTHCVSSGRTAKQLKALLNGLWVMDKQWVVNSHQNGSFLKESAWGRRIPKGQLLGLTFYMSRAFQEEAQQRNTQLLKLCKRFVRSGGGTFVEALTDATSFVFVAKKEDTRAYSNKCLSWESFLELIENLPSTSAVSVGGDGKDKGAHTPSSKLSRQFETPLMADTT